MEDVPREEADEGLALGAAAGGLRPHGAVLEQGGLPEAVPAAAERARPPPALEDVHAAADEDRQVLRRGPLPEDRLARPVDVQVHALADPLHKVGAVPAQEPLRAHQLREARQHAMPDVLQHPPPHRAHVRAEHALELGELGAADLVRDQPVVAAAHGGGLRGGRPGRAGAGRAADREEGARHQAQREEPAQELAAPEAADGDLAPIRLRHQHLSGAARHDHQPILLDGRVASSTDCAAIASCVAPTVDNTPQLLRQSHLEVSGRAIENLAQLEGSQLAGGVGVLRGGGVARAAGIVRRPPPPAALVAPGRVVFVLLGNGAAQDARDPLRAVGDPAHGPAGAPGLP
mmetsp:Transcript_127751/g.361591  ORF Transcript_127751/g.361591 Transcript_127751/m.361591 type:complete len:346 (-) Transcript_127751:3-1040(-)